MKIEIFTNILLLTFFLKDPVGLHAKGVSLSLPVSLFLRHCENDLSALQYGHIILDYGVSVCSILSFLKPSGAQMVAPLSWVVSLDPEYIWK